MKTEIEQTADNIVRSEVLLCVSTLVDDAAQEEFSGIDDTLELFTGPIDYEEAGQQHYDDNPDDGREWLEDAGYSGDAVCGIDADGQREYCEYFDVDLEDYQREVFEHWAVSRMLADDLEAQGETVVRDWHGLTIWARTTTGQAISLDGVMQRIAADLYRRVHE